MELYTVDPTPNPDSLKFTAVATSFIEGGLRSYSRLEEAEDDPLASSLFAIEGVADVLILPAFLTITKSPAADWNRLLPQIEVALERHLRQ